MANIYATLCLLIWPQLGTLLLWVSLYIVFISFLLVDFGLAIGWFALSTMLLEMRAASIESPQIEPYLDQVLD